MKQSVTITVTPDKEKDSSYIQRELFSMAASCGIAGSLSMQDFVLVKRSVDARHKSIKIHLRYEYRGKENPTATVLPVWKQAESLHKVIVVGSGPAGLFASLTLLEHGIKPIVIERGEDCAERKISIEGIQGGLLNENSNYCFGLGGAGTFSDGKLYTRSNKRGDIPLVLQIFHYFGADKKILTDAHPHIGTDKLPSIIQAIKDKIIALGGEVLCGTKCTGFITQKSKGELRIIGIRTKNAKDQAVTERLADAVILATGHSATDIYKELSHLAPNALEAKTFAVGVRVEHPRALIDKIMYHNAQNIKALGAAEYHFTSQQEGRGVYSFCMCPGGFVVPSATQKNQIVVNGMSDSKRNSTWSNAAFVVETRPEDIDADWRKKAREEGLEALAPLYWRTALEEKTFSYGEGQKAPAQRLTDFVAKKESSSLPQTSYAPGIVPSRLDAWLPKQISARLALAFKEAESKMHGFFSEEAVLIASETRTSTPCRILRQPKDSKGAYESVALKNLYPAGEGAGYAGGIVSSAMDGIKVATAIAERFSL